MTTATDQAPTEKQVLSRICEELPGWTVEAQLGPAPSPYGKFAAIDPTFGNTGLTVWADTPSELLERVRAVVKIFDVCAGKLRSVEAQLEEHNRLLKRRAVVGQQEAQQAAPAPKPSPTTYKPPTPPVAPSPTATGAGKSVEVAKAQGFTGDPCEQCGSPNTRRAGTCMVCMDCSYAGGCG